jgi:hypothetical protein
LGAQQLDALVGGAAGREAHELGRTGLVDIDVHVGPLGMSLACVSKLADCASLGTLTVNLATCSFVAGWSVSKPAPVGFASVAENASARASPPTVVCSYPVQPTLDLRG